MGRLVGAIFVVLALAFGTLAAGARAEAPVALARVDLARSSVAVDLDTVVLRLGLSQPVPYRLRLMADPPRLVVDFREVEFAGLRAEAFNAGALPAVSWGRLGPGWSRMVAELPGPMRIVAAEEVTEGQPELRVSLAAVGIDAFRAAVAAQPAPDWGLPRPAAVEAPKRRQTGEAPLVVVIDPGHGGIDPGAEAPGLSEAEVILTFARGLKEVLTRAGIEVVLTREEDVFVPLETRVSVARAAGADIFLSLHADALAEGEAVGATVYTLAEEASDAASELLAERHDRADLLAGVDLEGHDDQVAGVLMDLARTETAPRSERLAEALAGAIGGAGIRMHRHPHQRAAFSVLKSPDIPSVLLELGFLSSEADRARLTDPAWRELMAQAILAAIKDWALADAAEARRLRR